MGFDQGGMNGVAWWCEPRRRHEAGGYAGGIAHLGKAGVIGV